MNISGIKLRIASKRLVSRIQDPAVSEEIAPIESVVVILDSEEVGLVKCFRELKDFLRVKDENFSIIFSVASKDRKSEIDGIFFTAADLTWAGKFKGELQEIRNRSFDLLICFTKENDKAANFLSGAMVAGLKVSRQNEEDPVFDLSICTGPEEKEIFTEELKKYLKVLNRIKE